MANDSFIREVNEHVRQEQARALWSNFGPVLIGAAILVVLGTAGWVGYDYWSKLRSGSAGEAYSNALSLAHDGKDAEANAALAEIEKDGAGAYPGLARLRAAGILATQGDAKGAVAGFDAAAKDSTLPVGMQDLARLRAGYLLVDSGSYADVAQRVEAIAVDTNPLRFSAREALGLAAWKEGKSADALKLFQQIVDDDGAPRAIRERAGLMLGLLHGAGAASAS